MPINERRGPRLSVCAGTADTSAGHAADRLDVPSLRALLRDLGRTMRGVRAGARLQHEYELGAAMSVNVYAKRLCRCGGVIYRTVTGWCCSGCGETSS